MPEVPSSAVRRALASALRRLREHAGMSGDEVAEQLGWSASKVSRIETHRTAIKPRDLALLLDLYGIEGDQRDQLNALADEQDARGWWATYASSLAAEYVSYISLEDSAARVRAWSPELIHGLLQTEEYANGTMATVYGEPPRMTPGDIQRRVEARLRRQRLLSKPSPKEFFFVLDEAALRHRLGTAETMRAQLAQLERLSRLPRVTIQVLPFASTYPIGPGGFAILSFAEIHSTRLADVVYTEHLTHSSFVETEGEIYEYQLAFGQLTERALTVSASRELIARVAHEAWSSKTA